MSVFTLKYSFQNHSEGTLTSNMTNGFVSLSHSPDASVLRAFIFPIRAVAAICKFKGVVYCFFSRLDCVYGVQSYMC